MKAGAFHAVDARTGDPPAGCSRPTPASPPPPTSHGDLGFFSARTTTTCTVSPPKDGALAAGSSRPAATSTARRRSSTSQEKRWAVSGGMRRAAAGGARRRRHRGLAPSRPGRLRRREPGGPGRPGLRGDVRERVPRRRPREPASVLWRYENPRAALPLLLFAGPLGRIWWCSADGTSWSTPWTPRDREEAVDVRGPGPGRRLAGDPRRPRRVRRLAAGEIFALDVALRRDASWRFETGSSFTASPAIAAGQAGHRLAGRQSCTALGTAARWREPVSEGGRIAMIRTDLQHRRREGEQPRSGPSSCPTIRRTRSGGHLPDQRSR